MEKDRLVRGLAVGFLVFIAIAGLFFLGVKLTGFVGYIFDAATPYGYKLNPADSATETTATVRFEFNATDYDLSNATLYVWNASSLVGTNTTDVTGTYDSDNLTWVFTRNGNYVWNILIVNTTSYANWADAANFTLTISGLPDLIIPYFTGIPGTSTIIYGENVSVTFNATDDTAFDNFVVNNTKFAINKSGYLNNSQALAVGTYNLNITINDTSNNLNSTNYQVVVNKASTTLTYYLNSQNTANITSATPFAVNASAYTTAGTAFIFRNGTDITANNGENVTYTEGYYEFIFNVTGNQNYSDVTSKYLYANITAVVDSTAPYFIESPGNVTLIYGISYITQFNATDETLFGTFVVNDSRFSVNASGYFKNASSLGVGLYSLNLTINDSSNNMNNSYFWVNVTKAGLALTPYINNTNANFTATNGTATTNVWLNGTSSPTINITLYLNGSIINNGNSPLSNQTNLSVGYYNFTVYYEGNQNYSSNITWLWINNSLAAVTATPAAATSSSGSTSNTGPFWMKTIEVFAESGKGEQLVDGVYTATLAFRERLKINIANESHYIGIVKLTNISTTANVTLGVYSTPQQIILQIGDEKEFDVNEDGENDLSIKLNSIFIESRLANITIRELRANNIGMVVQNVSEEPPETPEKQGFFDRILEKINRNYLLIALSIILVIIALLLLVRNTRKKR